MRFRRRPASLHSVFGRTLHEHRRSLAGWSAGLFFFAVLMAALYPTIRDNPQIAGLRESYPKALRSLFAITDLTTGTGFIRAEVFSLVGPLLLIILAVLWGGDLIAGEEDRGTIDILLANPVSRTRVLLEKWAALMAGVAGTGLALAVGLAIAIPLAHMQISPGGVAAAVVSLFLLAVLFGTVALAVGAATGRRGVARGTAVVLAVAAYLISSLADVIGWLRAVRLASPWYHALGIDPLANGFSAVHLLVPVGLTAVTLVVGAYAFDRRDVAV